MLHIITARKIKGQLRSGDLSVLIEIQIENAVVAGRRRSVSVGSVRNKNDPFVTLYFAYQPLCIYGST